MVVYEIANGESTNNTGLNHEDDNNRPANTADLGEPPVEITTGYYTFDVTISLPTDYFPTNYNEVHLRAIDPVTQNVIKDKWISVGSPGTSATPRTTYNWKFAPEDVLPVYDTNYGTGVPNYRDYGIYEYQGIDSNKTALANSGYDYDYHNFGDTTPNGVIFVVSFEEWPDRNVVIPPTSANHAYFLAPTRRYTTKELIDPVTLGIATTYDIDVERTIVSTPSGINGLYYEPPEQYFYFAALPGDPYYIEYQDQYTTAGTGLTGNVSVVYYEGLNQQGSISPIATILSFCS
jgi:hypothetical protein